MRPITFYEFDVDVALVVYGPDWEGDDALYQEIRERVLAVLDWDNEWTVNL